MTDLPIRADWWREVTDPDEVIPAGCPVRTEEASEVRRILIAHEYVAKKSEPRPNRGRRRIFIDSRWTPPVRKLKVGDRIETEAEAASLPVGTVATDKGKAWQRTSELTWRNAFGSYRFGYVMVGGTIIWLPDEEAEQ